MQSAGERDILLQANSILDVINRKQQTCCTRWSIGSYRRVSADQSSNVAWVHSPCHHRCMHFSRWVAGCGGLTGRSRRTESHCNPRIIQTKKLEEETKIGTYRRRRQIRAFVRRRGANHHRPLHKNPKPNFCKFAILTMEFDGSIFKRSSHIPFLLFHFFAASRCTAIWKS